MLRKLFIGLLILSALTSRGAGNEISDTTERLSPESFLSLCGEKAFTGAEPANAREFATQECIAGFTVNATFSLEEFLRVKSLEQHIFGSTYGYPSYGCRQIGLLCIKQVSYPYDENLISGAADTSPPAI